MIIQSKNHPFNRYSIENRPGLPILTNGEYAYMPILKNAHTWLLDVFGKGLNWEVAENPQDVASCKKIIVLRDPIQRWISAMATYLHDKKKVINLDTTIVEVLVEGTFFDWHTLPQIVSLDGMDTDRCLFFYMDSNTEDFTNNIKKFIKQNFDSNPDYEMYQRNDGSNKPKHSFYKQHLTSIIQGLEGVKLKTRLYHAYLDDFNMLDELNNEKYKYLERYKNLIKSKESYENFNR